MLYFSYNDFIDCTENGEIDKITKVEEKRAEYEIKNGEKTACNNKNQLIKILKEKIQLKKFLFEFLNLTSVGNIIYYNNIKSKIDKEINNNIICKIKDKEIFIFIKVIENIDSNISYKMFEHSLNIIKRWNLEEKIQNKRNPIVIPIVIYIGNEKRTDNKININNKVKYITFKENRINFSYNMIDINNFEIDELQKNESNIAKELIKIKNKYLQIN